jgi:hypothetical protein
MGATLAGMGLAVAGIGLAVAGMGMAWPSGATDAAAAEWIPPGEGMPHTSQ